MEDRKKSIITKHWAIKALLVAFLFSPPFLNPFAPERTEPVAHKTPPTLDSKPYDERKAQLFSEMQTQRFIFSDPLESDPQSYPTHATQTTDHLTLYRHLYRRQITLHTASNPYHLVHQPLCITIDSLQWIRESKLPFEIENIYFTDDDGTTIIPHFIEYGYGEKNTKIWISIPRLNPGVNKTIYCYYSQEPVDTPAEGKTFLIAQEDLLGWYFFERIAQPKVPDLSNLNQYGYLSKVNYESDWARSYFDDDNTHYIFFNDWKSWYSHSSSAESVYFTLPKKNVQTLSRQGSIEFLLNAYHIRETITQHLFIDSNQQLSLGLMPDQTLYFQAGDADNQILWDYQIEHGAWTHLVINWDFGTQSVQLYINGKAIPQKTNTPSFQWPDQLSIGDLHFGGYHTPCENYGFSGYLNNLRLYKQPLSAERVRQYHIIHAQRLHFPKFTLGKEELARTIDQQDLFIDFCSTLQIPETNNVQINLIYNTPLTRHYGYFMGSYYKSYTELINKIRNPDRYQPVFGFYSHFYSNVGTEIKVKDNYLVHYIGLKINDLSMIHEMKISFYWMVDYTDLRYYEYYSSYSWYQKLINWLIPEAYACGPYYSFLSLGESKLDLAGICNNIYWFKLKNPLHINPSASIMQVEYLLSETTGVLQLQLEDIILIGQDRQWLRANLYQETPHELMDLTRYYDEDDFHLNAHYIASMYPSEKGSIDLMTTPQNDLALLLKNHGLFDIIIDDETLHYFSQHLFTQLQIKDPSGTTLATITLEDIATYLGGVTIPRHHFLYFPILRSWEMEPQKEYAIYLIREDEPAFQEPEEKNKIISWFLGDTPYDYFPISSEGSHWKSIWSTKEREIRLSK